LQPSGIGKTEFFPNLPDPLGITFNPNIDILVWESEQKAHRPANFSAHEPSLAG
jgi:hypothetical protein